MVDCSLETLVKEAVSAENEREEDICDDAEGWPLTYVPFASPLTSPSTSPFSSPYASPFSSPLSSRSPSPCVAEEAMSKPKEPYPPSPTTNTDVSPRKPRTHKQEGAKKRRQRKRAEARDPVTRKIRKSQSKRYQKLDTVKTTFKVHKLTVTRAGFIGKRFNVAAEHNSLQSYLEEGFKVVEWDGRYAVHTLASLHA